MQNSSMDKMILKNLYSSLEKQSIYQTICAVRMIAQHHMEEKAREINEFMNLVGFTEQERVASRNLGDATMTKVLKEMDEGKKIYFRKIISSVAVIGGTVQKEFQFVIYIFEKCGIDYN